MSETNAKSTSTIAGLGRICGRYINSTTAIATAQTICCKYQKIRVFFGLIFITFPARQHPFRVGVVFNDNEAVGGTTSATNDLTLAPAGIIGFKLEFFQGTC